MILICTIITLLMAGSMFVIPRDKKISLIFVAAMTLSTLELSFLPALRGAVGFLTIFFILSEYKHFGVFFYEVFHNKSLKKICVLLFIMVIFDIVFSPHLHSISDALRYFVQYVVCKYFFIFYAFVSIKNDKQFKILIKYSMVGMTILTIFGIINLLQGRAIFVTEMLSNHNVSNITEEAGGDLYVNASRFRVQSMFQNPFNYGYVCCICLMLFVYTRKQMNNLLFYAMMFCCLFGIILCGCRTIVVCTLCGIASYILMAYKIKRIIAILILFFISLIVSYSFIPIVKNTIDLTTSAFTDLDSKEYGGSSLSMRTIQTAAVLNYIKDYPLFGRGVNYFNIDLGWATRGQALDSYQDIDLMGMEGVYLTYLLEHGFVGYILYLIVWFIILYVFVKNKHIDKSKRALGVSIWIIYFSFANMTGELGCLMPTSLIIGGVIGLLKSNCYTYNTINSKVNFGYFDNHC